MKLLLVEAGPKILPVLPDHLIERATTSLEARGVTFLTGLPVTNVAGNEIDLKDGQKLVANTFVWTGGVQGNPLIGESGLEVNRGRATVDAYLQSTSQKRIRCWRQRCCLRSRRTSIPTNCTNRLANG